MKILINPLVKSHPGPDMSGDDFFHRLFVYSKERFTLGQFIPLALVLAGVLAIGTKVYLGQKIMVASILLSSAALFLFLLRLRIFDEFKDYVHDLEYYPLRPVPRGLISQKELIMVLVPVTILEFIIAVMSGIGGSILFLVTFFYSLLMLREFFLREWFRSHFTIYILSHEILIFPLFFYLCAINGFSLSLIGKPFFWFLVVYVGSLFFLLEITRKVRPKDTEIASRDTYTAQYGIRGASLLVATVCLVSIISLALLAGSVGASYFAVLFVPLLLSVYLFWLLYSFNKKSTLRAAKKLFLVAICFAFVSWILTAVMFIIK